MRWRNLFHLCAALLFLALSACAGSTGYQAEDTQRLADALRALGPGVDPDEADRAARISYSHARELAIAYEISDPPLVHNTKVNMGLKPRGLCWHWAEDMQKRLDDENFRTLDIQRAIANADNPLRIDHSTALISARGQPMQSGIVLDPWRNGGRLFWARVTEDTRYDWQPQGRILARRYGVTPVGD